MTIEYRLNSGVLFSCVYDILWCSKYRRPVLTEDVRSTLEQIVRRVCAERSATVVSLKVQSDRVELQVDVDPQFGVHRLVKQIKAESSRDLRSSFEFLRTRLPTLWSNSYCVTTSLSGSKERISQYLEEQRYSPVRAREDSEDSEAA